MSFCKTRVLEASELKNKMEKSQFDLHVVAVSIWREVGLFPIRGNHERLCGNRERFMSLFWFGQGLI